MIFIDLETTGLLKPEATELKHQPYIIEICAIKTNNNFEIIDELTQFVKPPINIEPFITKITGIDDGMVAKAQSFPELYYNCLKNFFLGEETVIAHNCPFDMGVLWAELSRMGKEFHFPWPPEWVCTVEKTMHFENRRMKLSELHEKATGRPHQEGAHRARADVIALINCYQWLVIEDLI